MRTTTQTRLTRKLLSVFMAVAMALSLVGVSGFAYAENVEEADGTNTEVVDPTVTDVDVEGETITEGDGGEDEEFGGFGGLGFTVDDQEGESDEEGNDEEGDGEDDGIMELSLPDGITITGTQPTVSNNKTKLVFSGGESTITFSKVKAQSENEAVEGIEEDAEALDADEEVEGEEGKPAAQSSEETDIQLHTEDSGLPVFKGVIDVRDGAKLTLTGDGKIDATGIMDGGQLRSVITVEGSGSTLTLQDNVTITGGSGTLVHTDSFNETELEDRYVAGGGVLVQRTANNEAGAAFYMEGGTIDRNEANAGGGIFIDRNCCFDMTGGTVSNNTAKVFEGGGIYVAGKSNGKGDKARIAAGKIVSNTCKTSYAWGGGGIFVEVEGSLKVGTASITGNTAWGLGGGVSGCPHAAIGIGAVTAGAAIFNNTAEYSRGRPENKVLRLLKTYPIRGTDYPVYSGDMYAYGLEASDVSSRFYGGPTGDIAEAQKGAWSKAADWKRYAQDFYCTKASHVYGTDLGQADENAWIGYVAGAKDNTGYKQGANSFGYSSYADESGSFLPVKKGDTIKAYDASLGLTSTAKSDAYAHQRTVFIEGNTSQTHGGGIACNGVLSIDEPAAGEFVDSFSLSITKEFKNDHDETLSLKGNEFKFELVKGDDVVASATNDADGKVFFTIPGEKYIDKKGGTLEFDMILREVPLPSDDDITYDTKEYPVHLSVKTEVRKSYLTSDKSRYIITYVPEVTVTYDKKDSLTITNVLNLRTEWSPDVDKHYFGAIDGTSPSFGFTLTGITAPDFENGLDATLGSLERTEEPDIKDLASLNTDAGGNKKFMLHAINGSYADSVAEVLFSTITYRNAGEYWYTLKEDAAQDPTIYVMKVVVEADKDKQGKTRKLAAKVDGVWCAYGFEGIDLTVGDLDVFEGDKDSPTSIDFYNMDINRSFAAYGYRVNAASNVALDQQCLVDPKVWKQLEGQPLKGGEFQFRLIEVADYNSTEGINGFEVVARNDEYGMVDFDEAGNVAAPGEDPCCLSFTTPGTRYYRIIEDEDYKRVPYVDYSTEAITFTVDVIRNDAGQLEVASMFYGKLVDGENVPFEEESKDPTWHPTITNVARGMDLMVQKTSEADRTEGLEGAVYDLYMVSDGAQGDVYMGSGTSDADGWILYEDVNLMTGTPYYFKEKTPPAGHTVDGFRSLYFYLVPDATAENGYAIKYVDNLGDMGEEAEDQEQVTGAAAATTKQRAAGDKMLFTYAHDGGVYDAVTSLDFNKLDTRTHEWVEGAQLSVIEKATGQLVSSWTTGKAGHTIARQLDVDVEYILREDQAPAGYDKANEVVFKLDQYGNVQILSGGGDNAEVQESTLTLYDTMFDTENVIYRMNETLREVPGTDGSSLPQTGDDTFGRLLAATLLGVAALCLMTVAALALRRKRKNMQ